ncbi:MAG: transposase [Gammaproteobacteria bacterium]|nr:transposase [Gammaproteobacteria bacterium]NIR83898.1 transposase [Gammaproteobacteria bacterium]NIR90677.1 transposase [Gammaproteobacteria bacterium]NIV76066.1 transposase [Gammaproteobacteria bacterium]
MPNYRRCRVPGGCYFFTVITARRQPLLVEHVALLRAAFRDIRSRHPFTVEAVVILPDHLHCIWTLPEGDSEFPRRWRLIKARFTELLPSNLGGVRRRDRGERAIWQPRFWEHVIRNERDYRRHVDYIHYNPVKHGYVRSPAHWPYSSFERFVRTGVYCWEWGGEGVDGDMVPE